MKKLFTNVCPFSKSVYNVYSAQFQNDAIIKRFAMVISPIKINENMNSKFNSFNYSDIIVCCLVLQIHILPQQN